MNSRSYVIFLTYRWCILSLSISATGRDRSARHGGTDQRDRAGQIGEKSQKIGAQHDGKNFFCALFLIFSKNFYALKTPVFACFRLFCEPLRARVFSLYLKKTARKIFFKNLLTVGTPTRIIGTVNRTAGNTAGQVTGTAPTV